MAPPARSDRAVFISGASAGIGQALAEALAAPGVTLGLLARRRDRLSALQQRLEARGARVFPYSADVREARAVGEAVRAFHRAAGRLSLVVANAGISESDALSRGDPSVMSDVIATNVQGVIHTLAPAIPLMTAQGGGQLAALGSVAGFRGLSGKGAYCASKAAVKTLMDSWRLHLEPLGIRVTTLCPGWVHSELTAKNPYPMPFIMSAERAAQEILRALEQGRRTYVFPWQMRLVVPLLRAVPDRFLPKYE
ncbi:MAG: SDR family NAD(P)-dependent oxidoreductase [Candidatus Lambdaproteobacteria bacterium]|nr:SDR family NAD(P)-dependent oxidoreductase [Candidatus Lambdaproteobacteria bacterium]